MLLPLLPLLPLSASHLSSHQDLTRLGQHQLLRPNLSGVLCPPTPGGFKKMGLTWIWPVSWAPCIRTSTHMHIYMHSHCTLACAHLYRHFVYMLITHSDIITVACVFILYTLSFLFICWSDPLIYGRHKTTYHCYGVSSWKVGGAVQEQPRWGCEVCTCRSSSLKATCHLTYHQFECTVYAHVLYLWVGKLRELEWCLDIPNDVL